MVKVFTPLYITITILLYLFYFSAYAEKSYRHFLDFHVASDADKARMRYHNIDLVYEDWSGNLYFYRDGKRCKF